MQTTLPQHSKVAAGRSARSVPARLSRRVATVRSAIAPPPASGEGLTYRKAGVDIDAGDELVRRIQKLNPSIGGFSGLVPFGDSFLVRRGT
jgi:phosphoribosylformylglycinamidine cyclo-ligase